MLNKKKILILTETSKSIGNGHFVRTTALKNELKKNNKYKIYFINLLHYKIQKEIINKFKNIDLVIFDTPIFYKKIFLFFKSNQIPIFTLDWFHKYKPDYNIVIFKHKKFYSKKKSFEGLPYIILRNSITNLSVRKIYNKNILIVIGGGDKNNEGYEAAKIISKKGFNVTLIEGPLAKYPNNRKFKILKNPNNFNKILNSFNTVITNGGTCLFESIFLKKKIFVLPQSRQEIKVAKFFKSKKLIIDSGFKKLSKCSELIKNNNLLTKNLIDGKGLNRIVNIIKKILL